jgi:hypothetical protein
MRLHRTIAARANAVILVSALGISGLCGCRIENGGPPATQPVNTTKVSCLMPTFSPLPETKESQDKGGITVSVAPVPYQQVSRAVTHDQEVDSGISRTYSGGAVYDTPMRTIERTTTPVLSVSPERLAFVVTITNNLPRVFRGSGALVQFNVAGKLQGTDQTGYADLLNAMIPPRQQAQFTVLGPPLASLPQGSTTVGLSLYDIITAVDQAGNVTEKQNFDWFYTYAPKLAETEAVVKTRRIVERAGETTLVPQDQPAQPTRHRRHAS